MILDRPPRAEPLPFCRPTLEDDDIAEVVACLRSGWITTGPRAARFEEIFRERLGAPHALAVTSATAGLHLLLAAMRIGPGDEVIVPALTWPSTANVVELLGARTVFADVDPETLQIDPADVARRLTGRTRAVIAVHFAGAPADLDALRAVAGAIPVIEDAAHALGTAYRGREVGSGPFAAVFSFHPIKNATTGEGGMIVCHDDALAERIRLLRFHGVRRDAWKRYQQGGSPGYDVEEPGYKHNLPDLLAALGVTQMAKLDRMNAARAERAERYHALLASFGWIRPIAPVAYPHTHAWHLYVARVDPAAGIGRDELIGALGEQNVGAGLHFPAVHLLSHYRRAYGYRPGSLPAAEAAGESILSLPLYPALTAGDQLDVAAALLRAAPASLPQPALAS